jgi:hypothetical protein
MDHADTGKSVPLLQAKELEPREWSASATPRQPVTPYPSRAFAKSLKAGEVANDPVVPEVAPQLLRELMVLLLNREMQILSAPLR